MQKTALLFFLILLQVNFLVPMKQEKNLKRNSIEQLQQSVKKFCLEQSGNNYFKNVPVEIVKNIVTLCFDQKNGLKENVNTLLMIPLVCKQFQKAVEDYKDVQNFFVQKKVKSPLTAKAAGLLDTPYPNIFNNPGREAVFEFLLKYSDESDLKNIHENDWYRFFTDGIAKHNITLTQLFLERGLVNVNKQYNTQVFPLYYAAEKGFKGAVELLLKNGAKIDECKNGRSNFATALKIACENNNHETVRLLIKHGADVNLTLFDSKKQSSHIHIELLKKDVLDRLVEHGVRITLVSDLLKLLSKGYKFSDITKKLDKIELSVLFLEYLGFEERVSLDVVKEFVENGVNLNHTNRGGVTPLLSACIFFEQDSDVLRERNRVIFFLLKSNSNVNVRTTFGEGIVYTLCHAKNRDMVREVLKHTELQLEDNDIEIIKNVFGTDTEIIGLLQKNLQKKED